MWLKALEGVQALEGRGVWLGHARPPDGRRVRLDAHYEAFNADFGPPDLSAIARAALRLDAALRREGGGALVCVLRDGGPRTHTNGLMLLGAFLVLARGVPSGDVARRLLVQQQGEVEGYCDAGAQTHPFRLAVADCWRALERAGRKGWFPRDAALDAYRHYDDPLNADMHFIVPRVLALFKGPVDVPGTHRDTRLYANKASSVRRDFAPAYLADLLRHEGVTTVVRLSAPEYDADVFRRAGLRHEDIAWDRDGIARFFGIVDEVQGGVAVHGCTSLARAGTLAALYLMRGHGFDARAAIAWVRMVRPGSVIGTQQAFLCDTEAHIATLRVRRTSTEQLHSSSASAGRDTAEAATSSCTTATSSSASAGRDTATTSSCTG